jgi:hypothetical protein
MARLPNPDDEMEKIVEHLDRQDKTLQEILIVLRGSVALGVKGIIERQSQFEERLVQVINDVAEAERWQDRMMEQRGKITFTIADAIKNAFTFIGAMGTIVAAMLALKELFEK